MGETDLPAIARIYNSAVSRKLSGSRSEARLSKVAELDDIERDLVVLELRLGE